MSLVSWRFKVQFLGGERVFRDDMADASKSHDVRKNSNKQGLLFKLLTAWTILHAMNGELSE